MRVGVIDADVQSPGIHVLFGLKGDDITASSTTFSSTGCRSRTWPSTSPPPGLPGRIHLIPSSIRPGEITALRNGYDSQQLVQGLREFVDALELDALLVDTHPGLQEETLLSLVVADTLLVVLRPDQQDYEGTGVTVHVAKELEVPRIALVVNKSPASFDPAVVRERVEQAYDSSCRGGPAALRRDDDAGQRRDLLLQHPEEELSEEMVRVADFVRREG